MTGLDDDSIIKLAAAFEEGDAKLAALRCTCAALAESLREYVEYDLLSSDCPDCYMCNEGRAVGDTDQCIHQKAVALLAELAPADDVTGEKP